MDGIAHSRVRTAVEFSGASEVIERAENVIVVARRERKLQEIRIRDFTRGSPPKKSALEQILLAAPSRRPNLRPGSNRTIVLEQSLQRANRRVERRPLAVRLFAVPAAVIQLFAHEALSQGLGRPPEIRAKRQHAPVDARLNFASKEGKPAGCRRTQVPAPAVVVPTQA